MSCFQCGRQGKRRHPYTCLLYTSNRIPKPPIVMVKAGSSRVIVKRETYDDLIKNDV